MFPVKIGNEVDVKAYSESLIKGEQQLLVTVEGNIFITNGDGTYSESKGNNARDNILAIAEIIKGINLNKSDITHTHDNSYYTKNQIDGMIVEVGNADATILNEIVVINSKINNANIEITNLTKVVTENALELNGRMDRDFDSIVQTINGVKVDLNRIDELAKLLDINLSSYISATNIQIARIDGCLLTLSENISNLYKDINTRLDGIELNTYTKLEIDEFNSKVYTKLELDAIRELDKIEAGTNNTLNNTKFNELYEKDRLTEIEIVELHRLNNLNKLEIEELRKVNELNKIELGELHKADELNSVKIEELRTKDALNLIKIEELSKANELNLIKIEELRNADALNLIEISELKRINNLNQVEINSIKEKVYTKEEIDAMNIPASRITVDVTDGGITTNMTLQQAMNLLFSRDWTPTPPPTEPIPPTPVKAKCGSFKSGSIKCGQGTNNTPSKATCGNFKAGSVKCGQGIENTIKKTACGNFKAGNIKCGSK